MAEQLLLCADNLYSVVQYPGHTVSADQAATNYEAFRVANGRRQAGDRWSPTSANASHYVQVRADTLRGANFIAIDRGSNLVSNARAGNTSTVTLTGSNDNFTTSRTVASVTLAGVTGGTPAGALGCVTTEGAWLKTFSADAFNDWRVTIPAMGSGVTQKVTGLWLGLAWAPSAYVLRYPLGDMGLGRLVQESVAPSGWRGRSRVRTPRRGVLRLALPTEDDYDAIGYQILGLMAKGQPAWLCWQKTDAPWRAVLVSVDGELDWSLDAGYHTTLRSVDVPFIEEQPFDG